MSDDARIEGTLSQAKYDCLKAGFDANRTWVQDTLRDTIPKLFPLVDNFVRAVDDAFYTAERGADESGAQPFRRFLTLQDRERCIIALLASRGATTALAIHIYLALMYEVSPEEIAHIIFLTAIYSGVDRLVNGLAVEKMTLKGLGDLVQDDATDPIPPETVFRALKWLPPGT